MKGPTWKNKISFSTFLIIVFLLISCRSPEPKKNDQSLQDSDSLIIEKEPIIQLKEWEEITFDNSGIILDIRYATTNNFTKNQIYDCPRCYLRPIIANKLKALNKYIMEKHQYQIKVFDCYRPRPAQQKLWDIVPNPIYVTPPEKGSMHNRGMAIDLTLVDRMGNELDMGTEYDFFGKAAHTDHFDLSPEVLENRVLLQELMKSIGFKTIQSEWWHFSYTGEMFPLSDWEWPCK